MQQGKELTQFARSVEAHSRVRWEAGEIVGYTLDAVAVYDFFGRRVTALTPMVMTGQEVLTFQTHIKGVPPEKREPVTTKRRKRLVKTLWERL